MAKYLNQNSVVRTNIIRAVSAAINMSSSNVDTISMGGESLSTALDVTSEQFKLLNGSLSTGFGDQLIDGNESVGIGSESLKAGLVAAAASKSPRKHSNRTFPTFDGVVVDNGGYHSISDFNGFDVVGFESKDLLSGPNVNVEEVNASIIAEVGGEAFDNFANDGAAILNTIFNVNASRQTAFAEMFFKTKVMTADQGTLLLQANINSIYNNSDRNPSGTGPVAELVNLADANRDPSILASTYLGLVPIYRDSADAKIKNTQFFSTSDPATARTFTTATGEENVVTRSLRPGTEVNIIDISQSMGASGVVEGRNFMDAVAPDASVSSFDLALPDDLSDPANPVPRTFRLNVNGSPYARFTKAINGTSRQVDFNFKNAPFVLDLNSKLVNGNTIAEFAAANIPATVQIRVAYEAGGNGDLQKGTFKVSQLGVRVIDIYDTNTALPLNERKISLADPAYAPVIALIESITMRGWTPNMRLTNSNIRFVGKFLNTDTISVGYSINLGEPIYHAKSLAADANASSTLLNIETITTNIRINNHHKAISTIQERFTQLHAILGDDHGSTSRERDMVKSLVFGAHLITPYVREDTFDFDQVNTLTSDNKERDLSAYIFSTVKQHVASAIANSNIRHIASNVTGLAKPTFIVKIGTDEVLRRFFHIVGEPRDMGSDYTVKYQVESTNQTNMAGEVYFSIDVENAEQSVLQTGVHAYVPELLVAIKPQHTQGGTVEAIMGCPRHQHVWISPIMVKFTFDVAKLNSILKSKVAETHQAI